MTADQMVLNDDWSNLRQYREMPEIDVGRLYAWRMARIKACLKDANAAMCLLVSPISLRYAVDY
ncbi:MAG: M24 family metallopeptidase, partial [Aestuariivirgaceae bacterium]